MVSSLDIYKKDLAKLIDTGGQLENAIQYECFPKEFRAQLETVAGKGKKEKIDELLKSLPSFRNSYQNWYSEAQSLIKQMLPNRLTDFTSLYEKPKNRKEIQFGNYVIADYLQGLRVTYGDEIKVAPSAAIPQFRQQVNILKSVQNRFESSLFEIQQLVQADLFDSELDAARELLKMKFGRAAGAISGVVLEKHLKQVCDAHNVKLTKKDTTIAVLNDALKSETVIGIPQWRFIQHLGDLRNLCDHSRDQEPTTQNVTDLIDGVEKITKTLF